MREILLIQKKRTDSLSDRELYRTHRRTTFDIEEFTARKRDKRWRVSVFVFKCVCVSLCFYVCECVCVFVFYVCVCV